MYIEIHHNTDDELNATDRAVLQALLGNDAPAAKAPVAEQPAAKPAAKKATSAAKKAAAKPEPTPEPEEAESADEDLLGDDEAPTMADAVELATELVSDGRSADVKAALAEAGAKRVSELKGAGIATFVNTLRG